MCGRAHRVMVSYRCGSMRPRARMGSCSCCSLAISSAWNTWPQGGRNLSGVTAGVSKPKVHTDARLPSLDMRVTPWTRLRLASGMKVTRHGQLSKWPNSGCCARGA